MCTERLSPKAETGLLLSVILVHTYVSGFFILSMNITLTKDSVQRDRRFGVGNIPE